MTDTRTRDARLDTLALGSNCHRCGATVDETCRTPAGRPTTPHTARIDRATAQYQAAKVADQLDEAHPDDDAAELAAPAAGRRYVPRLGVHAFPTAGGPSICGLVARGSIDTEAELTCPTCAAGGSAAAELEAEVAPVAPAKAPRLTPAQAAVAADFRDLVAGALTDPAKLASWQAGREAFGTLVRTAERWGETLGRRSFRGGPHGEVQATVSFELLEACRAHLAETAPELVRELRDARIDHLLTLAPIVTRTATPADRAAEAAAAAQLAHVLGRALAELTPAGRATYPRRPAPQADPAEIELEHATQRAALDAAIAEDELAGDLELFVDETPAPAAPVRPAVVAGGRGFAGRGVHVFATATRTACGLEAPGAIPHRGPVSCVHCRQVTRPASAQLPARQLALEPVTPDEDGGQLDVFEAVAQAELELAGGAR